MDVKEVIIKPQHKSMVQRSRCFLRKGGVEMKTVKEVLSNGELIEDYPDDKPYPSSRI